MKTDPKLPNARLVPRTVDDRISILRGRANEGARVAARGTVKVCRAVTVLAICGAGLAALNAGINAGPRPKPVDLGKLELRPIQFDLKPDIARLRAQIERDLFDPRLHDLRARQPNPGDYELTPEEIRQLAPLLLEPR